MSVFQSTHPRGVRPATTRRISCPHFEFQSTHPRGVRLGFKSRLRHHNFSFNPRTREGCDATRINYGGIRLQVSIHAPARGATMAPLAKAARIRMFQSTHPRGVRLCTGIYKSLFQQVSIHAPARGATQLGYRYYTAVGVSIHAPARGATAIARENWSSLEVSIHAPARGATAVFLVAFQIFYFVSIHAPARGATWLIKQAPTRDRLFQSTHPRGVRLGRGNCMDI